MAGQGVAGVLAALVSLVPQNFTSVGAIFWGANFTMLATLPMYWRHFRYTPEVRDIERRRYNIRQFTNGSSPRPEGYRENRSVRRILVDAWPQALNAFGVFCATFTVFPGVSNSWTTTSGIANFVPITTGIFQVGDVVGRFSPSFSERLILPARSVRWVMLLRALLFVPIFLWMRSPDVADPLKLLAMFFFSASNGYGGTLSMMYGPQQVEYKNEREVVGYIMDFSLVSGITAGSIIALLV
jgi:hypothetical protein